MPFDETVVVVVVVVASTSLAICREKRMQSYLLFITPATTIFILFVCAGCYLSLL